jgi:transglutaminase-like putative cysteine protease
MMRALVLESLQSVKLAKLATLLYMKSPTNKRSLLSIVDGYLRDRFIYQSEAIETLLYPDYMLSGLEISGHLVGDCDDISTLHAAILTALGFKVRFVAIKSTYNNPNFDHVYIEAQDTDHWIMYDVTLPLNTTVEYFGRLTIAV